MSGGWLAALLLVFVVHLVLFGRRWWRTRRFADAVTTLTFVLLVTSFGLRLVGPDWRLAGQPVFSLFRWAAWGSAAWRLGLWIRQRRGKPAAG